MAKRKWLIICIGVFFGLGGGFSFATPGAIYQIQVNGVIDPITADFIGRSIDIAGSEQAELILIQLQTPGGLGLSMAEITTKILGSKIPVVVFVAPSGARAASAGFFILMSADIGAMAPTTTTGAAHPVPLFEGVSQTVKDKITNDAAASMRGIATRRQRNADLAEQGVRLSKSYTDKEALDGGLIDLIAKDEAELLEKIDGRKVMLGSGREVVLHTRGRPVKRLPMSFRQRFWSFIADPTLAALLLIGGIILLMVEFSHPGIFVPGVIGGICLLLSFVGMNVLPVNYVGVLLILLALGFFIAEIKVGGFGALGLGGVVTMVLGLLMLIDTSRSEVGGISLRDAIVIVVPFAVLFMLLLRLALAATRARIMTGSQGMIGWEGVVQSPIDPIGKVFVRGELWNATSPTPIIQGRKVRVVRVDDLRLTVEEVRDAAVD